jgi:hypothetical protein
MHFSFIKASFSFLALTILAGASFSSFSGNTWQALEPRKLRPASHEGILGRRGNDYKLYHSAKIVFAEGC